MEIFAYADESEFTKNENDSNLITGSGILLLRHEIGNEIINEALENLSNDQSRFRSDDKTILKGYFHAKEGPRSRFHLIQGINKHISGRFRYSNFENHLESSGPVKRTSEELFRLTLGLASNEFFSNQYDKINLIIEERSKFNKPKADQWFESWLKQYDLQAYSETSFITYYPHVEIQTGNKKVAGLQVVDLLIWAFNRTRRTVPDNQWKDLLKISGFSYFAADQGPQSGGDCSLGAGLPYTGRLNYPVEVRDPNREEFYKCYVIIERTIRKLGKEVPPRINHMKPKFDSVLKKLIDPNFAFGEKILFEVASLFIRIFDTLPVYENLNDSDTEDWDILLKAKRMAGLYLRRDLFHSVRSTDEIIRWRHEIMTRDPSIFEPV